MRALRSCASIQTTRLWLSGPRCAMVRVAVRWLMANGPFTIRIFVPDGDPEGVRLIDRMNWTGHGIVFPREKWPTTKQRSEFSRTGVYILTGYDEGANEDLPTIYIGEGDVIRNRIESHYQNKD